MPGRTARFQRKGRDMKATAVLIPLACDRVAFCPEQCRREVVYLNDQPVLLGRDPCCGVHLPCPDVSRLHCELTPEDGAWHIRDLGSKNGLRVNGVRLPSAVLADRDQVCIGG